VALTRLQLREQLSATEAINTLLTSRVAELEAETVALRALLQPSMAAGSYAAGLAAGLDRQSDPAHLAMLHSHAPPSAFPHFGDFSPASTGASVTPDPFSPFAPQQPLGHPQFAAESPVDSAEEFSSRGGSIPATPDPGADLSQSPFMSISKRSPQLVSLAHQQASTMQRQGSSAMQAGFDDSEYASRPSLLQSYSSSYAAQLQSSDSHSRGQTASDGYFIVDPHQSDGYLHVVPQLSPIGLGLEFEGDRAHAPTSSPPEPAVASGLQLRSNAAPTTYMAGSVPGPGLGSTRMRATIPSATDVPVSA
jgi:hypothetical protein